MRTPGSSSPASHGGVFNGRKNCFLCEPTHFSLCAPKVRLILMVLRKEPGSSVAAVPRHGEPVLPTYTFLSLHVHHRKASA